MQNDPLYNRIMSQMPDTAEIESEISDVSSRVTALENTIIFTYGLTPDDGDYIISNPSHTPNELLNAMNNGKNIIGICKYDNTEDSDSIIYFICYMAYNVPNSTIVWNCSDHSTIDVWIAGVDNEWVID